MKTPLALLPLAILAVGAAAIVRQPDLKPAQPHTQPHAQPQTQPPAQPQAQPKPGPESGVPGLLPPGFPGEHRLLAELAGNYSATVKIHGAEGKPDLDAVGAAIRSTILGGRFLRDTLDIVSTQATFTLETTIGFSPDGKPDERFELVRLASDAFPMSVERGAFDNPSKRFTFIGELTIDGKRTKIRTVLQLESHDTQTLTVYAAVVDAADPAKVLTPEAKRYTITYERIR